MPSYCCWTSIYKQADSKLFPMLGRRKWRKCQTSSLGSITASCSCWLRRSDASCLLYTRSLIHSHAISIVYIRTRYRGHCYLFNADISCKWTQLVQWLSAIIAPSLRGYTIPVEILMWHLKPRWAGLIPCSSAYDCLLSSNCEYSDGPQTSLRIPLRWPYRFKRYLKQENPKMTAK